MTPHDGITERMLSLDEIEGARQTIAALLPPTPLRPCHAAARPDVFAKLECWQPTGSFKVRGALNALLHHRAEPVVAASAGNHALGLAWAAAACAHRGSVTLVVPHTAPIAKRDKLARFPVQLVVSGETYDEACLEAARIAQASGARMVHAFDDPDVAAGQGTVGLEILDQCPKVGTIVVPVGGGGLISGLAAAVKAKRPGTRIVAVQPEASPALRLSLARGEPLLEYAAAPTLADGLAGGIGTTVWAHRHLVDEIVEVGEAAIEQAIVELVAQDQIIAEASGAVSVAALRCGLATRAEGPTVVVLTGANLDATVLARLLSSRGETR